MSDSHNWDCGCWMCEDERASRGEESIHAKRDREANERAKAELAASGYRCTCTDPYAAFHSASCPWWDIARQNRRSEKPREEEVPNEQ